mgnify:CR=1 FL=1
MTASKKSRARVPKVGTAVRGSNTGRPIMVALDLLGRRTALRILWELREGPLTFRALQEACETTPGLLNTRLKELRASDIVTAQGRKLRNALNPLHAWSEAWAEQSFGKARD